MSCIVLEIVFNVKIRIVCVYITKSNKLNCVFGFYLLVCDKFGSCHLEHSLDNCNDTISDAPCRVVVYTKREASGDLSVKLFSSDKSMLFFVLGSYSEKEKYMVMCNVDDRKVIVIPYHFTSARFSRIIKYPKC